MGARGVEMDLSSSKTHAMDTRGHYLKHTLNHRRVELVLEASKKGTLKVPWVLVQSMREVESTSTSARPHCHLQE